MWLRFAPGLADPASWIMYKLGQPVSPLDVMLNGSQSQHAVGPEGISVKARANRDGVQEVLNIGQVPDNPSVLSSCFTPGHVICGRRLSQWGPDSADQNKYRRSWVEYGWYYLVKVPALAHRLAIIYARCLDLHYAVQHSLNFR